MRLSQEIAYWAYQQVDERGNSVAGVRYISRVGAFSRTSKATHRVTTISIIELITAVMVLNELSGELGSDVKIPATLRTSAETS